MTTPVIVTDGEGNAQTFTRNGVTGLVVYTSTLTKGTTLFEPAINPDLGVDMAVDGDFGGTPIGVYNGGDTAYWTPTAVTGAKFDFVSTNQFHSGAQSTESDKAAANDTMQFAKGSDQDLTSYTAISMWVYVTSGWTTGNSVSVYGYDTGGAAQVGVKGLLEDFFNEFDFNTWQKVSIPLSTLSLENQTIDSFRVEIESKSGAGVLFYMDDFQIEETGGGKEFDVKAPDGTTYTISSFRFSIVDALDTTLASNSIPKFEYDQFMSLSALSNGVTFQLQRSGEIVFSASIKTIGDSIKGGANLINTIAGATNACVTLETVFAEPVLLNADEDDKIAIIINDDLSTLLSFSALALGSERDN